MKTKISLFILSIFLPITSFASIDVEANLPAGTYHAPISVELTVTDPEAKTFYSFNPDGYPQDAYLYTGALLLKKSTPVVFFSIVDYANESKIKQNDYIIEYPSDVHFLDQQKAIDANATSVKLVLVNDASESVDIGYWQVQSIAELVEFPAHTMLASGERKEVSIAYTGSSVITLRSPDGDERAIMTLDRSLLSEKQTQKIVPKATKKQTFARFDEAKWKPIVQKLATPPRSSTVTSADVSVSNSGKVINPENVTDAPPIAILESTGGNITPADITPSIVPANNLKASASESGIAQNPLYVFGALGVLLGLGGIRWIMRRKA